MLASRQKEPHMPPPDNDVKAKPLTPQELGLIKLWIDQGAKGEARARRAPDRLAAAAAGDQPDLCRGDHGRRPVRRRVAGQSDFSRPRAQQARAGPADRSLAVVAAASTSSRAWPISTWFSRSSSAPTARCSPPAASARSSSGARPCGGAGDLPCWPRCVRRLASDRRQTGSSPQTKTARFASSKQPPAKN